MTSSEGSPQLGADEQTLARIDELSAATLTAAPGDSAVWGALWAEVFALPQWIFIARGGLERPQPYIGVFPQGPMLCAYTTPDRAREGALAMGLPEEEAGLVLAVPAEGIVDWAASFQQHGVVGITFDHPRLGFFSPLANLLPIRDWLASRGAG